MLKKKNGARNSLMGKTRARRFQRGEYSANASPAKNLIEPQTERFA